MMEDSNGLGQAHSRPRNSLKNSNQVMHDLQRNKDTFGKSSIRLRNDVEKLERHHRSKLHSVNKEKRVLKQELHVLRGNSGQRKAGATFMKEGRGYENKQESRHFSLPNASGKSNSTLSKHEISKLPLLNAKPSNKVKKLNTQATDVDDSPGENRNGNVVYREGTINSEKQQDNPKANMLNPAAQNLSKSEQSLHDQGPWYTNITEVRENINKRLSTSLNELPTEKKTLNSNDSDLTPFMYAHPDGMPRTMYLMPSFDERFKQAMKARYIRKPGTKLDPIEKELDIDEIFDRKSRDC